MNNSIKLDDFLKNPSVFFLQAMDEPLLIEADNTCFVLSKAKVEKVIFTNHKVEDALREYFISQKAECKAVDLGLSVKWAAGNLCSIKETEFGGFYYSGENEPRTFGKGMMGEIEENNFTGILPIHKDAAHYRLGSTWRIPTVAECRELIEHCEWTYYDDYLGSGVDGWKVSSLVEGFKDNHIFIPATSAYYDPDHDERLNTKGCTVLFTSTYDNGGYVKCLNVEKDWQECEMEGMAEISYRDRRYIGAVIRAVCK